jgi:aldose 1-epimerase
MDTAAQLAVAPSGTQWTISSAGHEAVLVEVGGGLRSYRVGGVDGVDIVDGFGESEVCPGCAGQILAPWPNRIRDGQYSFAGEAHQLPLTEPERHNAIHGLVNWARWRLVEARGDTVVLEHDLVPQPGYPWPLHLRTTWSVAADGLRAEHVVTNVGHRPAPFGLSVHPYLFLPGTPIDDLVLTVPGRNRLLVDGRLLPIGAARVAGTDYDFTEGRRLGTTVLDTAFGDVITGTDGGSQVSLAAPDGRSVAVWADESFMWWQVYSSDTLTPERLRRSVAIEPMTCPPDAFRSGRDVVTIEPGQSWRGAWGVRPSVGR